MRDLLFGLVLIAATSAVILFAPESTRGLTSGAASVSASPSSSATAFGATPRALRSWKPLDTTGAGFVVCRSDATWSAPADLVMYDAVAGWLPSTALSGRLGPAVGLTPCDALEPQLWLFGYRPTRYVADFYRDPSVLTAEPAPGYTQIVLTGTITPGLVVAADVKIAYFTLPAHAVTPTPTPPVKGPPVTPRPVMPSAHPTFDPGAPVGLSLPSTCWVKSTGSGTHADGLGATWSVQCGSAQANLAVADAAIAQGWKRLDGPPVGVGLQNYTKDLPSGTVWMQIAYRLDGPGFTDPFVIVQTYRSPNG